MAISRLTRSPSRFQRSPLGAFYRSPLGVRGEVNWRIVTCMLNSCGNGIQRKYAAKIEELQEAMGKVLARKVPVVRADINAAMIYPVGQKQQTARTLVFVFGGSGPVNEELFDNYRYEEGDTVPVFKGRDELATNVDITTETEHFDLPDHITMTDELAALVAEEKAANPAGPGSGQFRINVRRSTKAPCNFREFLFETEYNLSIIDEDALEAQRDLIRKNLSRDQARYTSASIYWVPMDPVPSEYVDRMHSQEMIEREPTTGGGVSIFVVQGPIGSDVFNVGFWNPGVVHPGARILIRRTSTSTHTDEFGDSFVCEAQPSVCEPMRRYFYEFGPASDRQRTVLGEEGVDKEEDCRDGTQASLETIFRELGESRDNLSVRFHGEFDLLGFNIDDIRELL